MKDNKKSFVMYNNYVGYFALLSLEERGALITAILQYANGEDNSAELEGGAKMAFAFIKDNMDRDTEEYLAVCKRNVENGKKGGRPKKDICETKKAGVFSDACEKPKKADNDNDNDIDIDIDIDIDNGNDGEKEKEKKAGDIQRVGYAPAPVSDSSAPCLSENEKEKLKKDGVTESYINERLIRAEEYARKNGKGVYEVLRFWWERDRGCQARTPTTDKKSFTYERGTSAVEQWVENMQKMQYEQMRREMAEKART